MSTYVVSDLHGQYDLFMEGLKEISFSSSDYLYCIGDAIDLGEHGVKILQEIERNKNMDLILGNHEQLMLSSVNPDGSPECTGPDTELWLYLNGGVKTFEEYKKLSVKMRKKLLFWMRNRELIKTVTVDTEKGKERYTLCHTYFIEEYDGIPYHDIPEKASWDIVWKSIFREEYETMADDVYSKYTDRTFITGHVPVQKVYYITKRGQYDPIEQEPRAFRWQNLVNIDGGLAYLHSGIRNGALFLRLEDMAACLVELSHEGHDPSLTF